MSDSDSASDDRLDDPAGDDLEPADRLFGAGEFFLPEKEELGLDTPVKPVPEGVAPQSPTGLLFTAVYANHLNVLLRPAKQPRIGEKVCDLYFYLKRLQREPDKDSGFVRLGPEGPRTKRAYVEYLYRTRRTILVTRTEAREKFGQAAFAKELPHIRASYELLSYIAEQVYKPQLGGNAKGKLLRDPLPELRHKLPTDTKRAEQNGKIQLPFKSSTLFCTYFMDLGPELEAVVAGIAAGNGRAELAEYLKKSPAHLEEFKAFLSFVEELAAMVKGRTYGCAMEVGVGASSHSPAQCHMHFLLSSANADGGFVNGTVEMMVIDPQKLVFRGKPPQHLGSSKVNRGARAGSCVQKALYYLLSDKLGASFSMATRSPSRTGGLGWLGL